MQRIAIFASGSGTNAQRIMEYFRDHRSISVGLVLSNRQDAPVLERAAGFHVPTVVFNRNDLYQSRFILDILSVQGIDLLVLAGFLWMIPGYLLRAYPRRIVNIHPALLPKYGGKGMYGLHVHEAVIGSGDSASGISIHFVNDRYDEGELILQVKCRVEPGETPESLAKKVHELEYRHYPKVIEEVLGEKTPDP